MHLLCSMCLDPGSAALVAFALGCQTLVTKSKSSPRVHQISRKAGRAALEMCTPEGRVAGGHCNISMCRNMLVGQMLQPSSLGHWACTVSQHLPTRSPELSFLSHRDAMDTSKPIPGRAISPTRFETLQQFVVWGMLLIIQQCSAYGSQL